MQSSHSWLLQDEALDMGDLCDQYLAMPIPAEESMDRISLPVRTEFGFQRTTCACELCSFWCRIMPGFLVPSDLQRLCPPDADLMAWAREHLRASKGFTVINP